MNMERSSGRAAVLMLLLAASCCLSAMAATTYYVSQGGDDSKDGTSWDTAFATPEKGFATVNSNKGSSLVIDTGDYALSNAIGCTGGNSVSTRSYVTSRTGNPEDVVLYSDGTFECLRLAGYIQVSGITFSNGVNKAGCVAGGIRFAASNSVDNNVDPTQIISNCVVTCCRNVLGADTNGAAVVMYNYGLMVNSVVRNNTAVSAGGGVLMVDQNNISGQPGPGPVLKGCRIEGNSAESFGAGVYVSNYPGSKPTSFVSPTLVEVIDCEIAGNTSSHNAAGMCCNAATTVYMTECVISNNVASGNSGGIRVENCCTLYMRDCLVSENAGTYGGGVDVIGTSESAKSTIFCTNTVFAANNAEGIEGSAGGAVRIYDSDAFFANCLFKDNKAVKNGGGASVYLHANAFFDGCRFEGNKVTGDDSTVVDRGGGGVFLASQNVQDSGIYGYCSASNCVFAGNTSATVAGGLGGTMNQWFSGAVVNCVFTNNACSTIGGGLLIRDTTSGHKNPNPPVIRNCLFAFNSAGSSDGGGVHFVTYSDITLENCTIVSNSAATGKSGGIHNRYGGALKNCIVAFNTAGGAPEGDSWTASAGLYINCCGWPAVTRFVGNGCVNADPRFTDPAHGDFSLKPGSPCRNAGSNESWMATAMDLLGNHRIVGDTVDIGCYEYFAPNCLMLLFR